MSSHAKRICAILPVAACLLLTGLWFASGADAESGPGKAGEDVSIRTFGPRVVAITFGPDFNVKTGAQPTSYRVQLRDGREIQVARVGRAAKPHRLIHKGWPYKPVMQQTAFLLLDRPLPSGADVAVAVDQKVTGRSLQLRCRYDSTQPAPELIKLNQCGYLPDDPRKLAYLGGWLGDLGPLSLDDLSGSFRVLDAQTGRAAFEGTAQLSQRADPASGEDVYWLDFSPLRKPGKYVIEVEGVGRSYPFDVDAAALAPALVTVARGLYHQRCGIALTEPYTRFTHPACHRGKAKLVTYYNSMDGKWMKMLPEKVDPSGKLIDGWGGWHDAGDYDRLLSRHIQTVENLLKAYDANAGKFYDGQLNLPESGNGIPDILDEAKWGLDWFERMYDPSDGAFYYRIETPNYGDSAPQDDHQQLYCMQKYPYYSCYAGAPFAHAARIFRQFDAELADHYLDIARSALAYGQREVKKPRADGRLHNAIAWVAAEIYSAAGDRDAHRIFLSSRRRDSWSYALCERPDVDAGAREAARRTFVEPAEELLKRQAKSGYITCFKGGRGGDQAMWDAATLLRGYVFAKDEQLRTAAMLSLDHHLGANPLGYSWITGVGKRYPKYILQIPSEYDDIDEPVPGIPIYGPRALSPTEGSTHGKVFAQNLYPAAANYPYLRSYSELPAVVPFSEFTHRSQSIGVFAYSFFAPDHKGSGED